MRSVLALAGLLSLAQAAPAQDSGMIVDRASKSCTFTTAAAVASGKSSCSTIILNNIAVPAGTTLDLTKLKSGTQVRYSL